MIRRSIVADFRSSNSSTDIALRHRISCGGSSSSRKVLTLPVPLTATAPLRAYLPPLVRSNIRMKELAIRYSLGAARGRLALPLSSGDGTGSSGRIGKLYSFHIIE